MTQLSNGFKNADQTQAAYDLDNAHGKTGGRKRRSATVPPTPDDQRKGLEFAVALQEQKEDGRYRRVTMDQAAAVADLASQIGPEHFEHWDDICAGFTTYMNHVVAMHRAAAKTVDKPVNPADEPARTP